MGLFSGKKKVRVSTSAVQVVDDLLIPSAMDTALLEATFENRSLIESIQDHALNGNFRKFERMYRYAKRGDYHLGLPNARVITSSDGFQLAEAAIELEVGHNITLDYLHYRPLNNIHAGWEFCYDDWGYNPDTNELVALSAYFGGIPFYLDKMVAVHDTEAGLEPEQSSIGTWENSTESGYTPERPNLTLKSLSNLVINQEMRFEEGAIESVEIHYIWVDAENVINRGMYLLDLTAYGTEAEYYQARYRYSIWDQDYIGYWIYNPLTGSHTELNAVFNPTDYIDPGTYFPFALFRSKGENLTSEHHQNSDEYESTRKLLKYIGVDYQDMGDALHENEDIKTVETAVLLLGVPIVTQNMVQMEYLHKYFDDLYERLPPAAQTYNPSAANAAQLSGAPLESYAVEIADADFVMTVSFDAVTRRLRSGVVTSPADEHGQVALVEYSNTYREVDTQGVIFRDGVPAGVASRSARVIRKQVAPRIYVEIQVINPLVRYNIRNKVAEGGLQDDNMIIPVDFRIAKEMQLLDIEELYYRSLNFMFNARQVTKTKWYESGAFKIVMIVAAIALTIYSAGTTWQGVVASAAAGATTTALVVAFLKVILVKILGSIIFKFVFAELTKVFGVEAMFWLAAAAAVVGGYKMINPASTVVSSSATSLLSASTGLVGGAQSGLEDMMKDLQKDFAELEDLMEDAQEELDKASDLLGDNIGLNPFTFIGQEPLIVFGEPPSAYYNRLSHMGNVGTMSMEIVQNFVDISLRLPSTQETIGETLYV